MQLQVLLACDLQHDVQGLLRALQTARVAHVEDDPLLPYLRGTLSRLVLSERRERHVGPSGEQVGLVPLRLSMAEKDDGGECVGHAHRRPRMCTALETTTGRQEGTW